MKPRKYKYNPGEDGELTSVTDLLEADQRGELTQKDIEDYALYRRFMMKKGFAREEQTPEEDERTEEEKERGLGPEVYESIVKDYEATNNSKDKKKLKDNPLFRRISNRYRKLQQAGRI